MVSAESPISVSMPPLFGERPPAHWLPRAHWHLCWLSYDPGLTDHFQGLDEALKEGEADPALPGYAAQFREVLGRPGGSGVQA